MRNETPAQLLKSILEAAFGLFLFGFGVHLTIRANIGVGPWDAFHLGLSGQLHILYGTASVTVSLIILLIDLLLREKIGVGMILDAFLVGKTVDLFDWLGVIPVPSSPAASLLMLFIGMCVMGFSQYLYMKTGLGCGPRDTLLVGLKRRLRKLPIGVISIAILAAVTFTGWLLGGPIGVGTVLCAGLEGPIMQEAFRLMKFDPTAVRHQSLAESARVLLKRGGARG